MQLRGFTETWYFNSSIVCFLCHVAVQAILNEVWNIDTAVMTTYKFCSKLPEVSWGMWNFKVITCSSSWHEKREQTFQASLKNSSSLEETTKHQLSIYFPNAANLRGTVFFSFHFHDEARIQQVSNQKTRHRRGNETSKASLSQRPFHPWFLI